MLKIVFWHQCCIALRSKSGSRSKVRVKVKGLGQGHAQCQRSKPNFWRAAVDSRGLALPSAAKSKEESLSVRGVCLCVELSRGCSRSAFNHWNPFGMATYCRPDNVTHTIGYTTSTGPCIVFIDRIASVCLCFGF